ncbi:hypothetical protein GCM10027200_67110 [Lentzea nigeriaca]
MAFEPPAPTTEITCVAPATRLANHGGSALRAVGTGATTAAGFGAEELVDLAALLTVVVVGTALELDSATELTVVNSADVVRCTPDSATGETCGDSVADTTTSAATATTATAGHKTLTARGSFARRRNIPISLVDVFSSMQIERGLQSIRLCLSSLRNRRG